MEIEWRCPEIRSCETAWTYEPRRTNKGAARTVDEGSSNFLDCRDCFGWAWGRGSLSCGEWRRRRGRDPAGGAAAIQFRKLFERHFHAAIRGDAKSIERRSALLVGAQLLRASRLRQRRGADGEVRGAGPQELSLPRLARAGVRGES